MKPSRLKQRRAPSRDKNKQTLHPHVVHSEDSCPETRFPRGAEKIKGAHHRRCMEEGMGEEEEEEDGDVRI